MRSQVQNGTVNPRYARMRPWCVSTSESADIMVKSGMKRSDGGTRYVKTNPRATSRRPRKRSRASAYAPRQPKTRDTAVVDTAMIVELRTYFRNGVCWKRRTHAGQGRWGGKGGGLDPTRSRTAVGG